MKKATVLFFVVATTLLDLGSLTTVVHDVHTQPLVHETIVEKTPAAHEEVVVVEGAPAVPGQETVVIDEVAPAHLVHETVIEKTPAAYEEVVVVEGAPAVPGQETVVIDEVAPAHHVHETFVRKTPAVVKETVIESPPTIQEIDIIEETIAEDDK